MKRERIILIMERRAFINIDNLIRVSQEHGNVHTIRHNNIRI